MRAAAQVEAEGDRVGRQPGRKGRELVWGQDIGKRREGADQEDRGIERDRPAGASHGSGIRTGGGPPFPPAGRRVRRRAIDEGLVPPRRDRKNAETGTTVAVRVDLVGSRIIKNKKERT